MYNFPIYKQQTVKAEALRTKKAGPLMQSCLNSCYYYNAQGNSFVARHREQQRYGRI